MRTHRVSLGANTGGGCSRLLISMYSYLAEVVAKPRLEERSRCRVQRLAWTAQHLVHDGRSGPPSGRRRWAVCRDLRDGGLALRPDPFIVGLFGVALIAASPAGALAL